MSDERNRLETLHAEGYSFVGNDGTRTRDLGEITGGAPALDPDVVVFGAGEWSLIEREGNRGVLTGDHFKRIDRMNAGEVRDLAAALGIDVDGKNKAALGAELHAWAPPAPVTPAAGDDDEEGGSN